MLNGYSTEDARDALQFIPADLPRDEWHRMGRAAIAAGLTVDDVDAWSAQAANYAGPRDVQSAFRTIKADGGTGPGTLFKLAAENGWSKDSKQRQQKPAKASTSQHKPLHAP